jgi:hypothetical protein
MTIKASIGLPNFKSEFEKGVIQEITRQFQKKTPLLVNNIKKVLAPTIEEALKSSRAYVAIASDQNIRGQIGLESLSKFDSIINYWANNISVEYKKNKGLGLINIGAIRSDYSDVLTLPEAVFISTNMLGNQTVVEWLNWLLLVGTAPVIIGYNFKAGNYPQSRTGVGIMIRQEGGIWSVPREVAGTEGNNFVTETADIIESKIDAVIRRELTKITQGIK